jgi:uncharacterized membrane protein YGL010W
MNYLICLLLSTLLKQLILPITSLFKADWNKIREFAECIRDWNISDIHWMLQFVGHLTDVRKGSFSN